MKLDLDYKDEKISSLTKELEDLNTGGATDEEVAAIKRQKHELELRLKDQVGTRNLVPISVARFRISCS